MRIDYIAPPGDGWWHNDSSPAINETNLNHLEKEVKELVKEVNDYVVENETELYGLKTGESKLVTKEQAALLDEQNIDETPSETSEHLVKSKGIYNFTMSKYKTVEEIARAAEKTINDIKSAFPSGEIKALHKVATSGKYDDLENKLEPGENISITKNGERNIISSTGGGSKIPVQSDIPVQKEGDIWFRTFEN